MGEQTLEDFTEFVTARWATLVRTAVFLGCGPGEAQDLVQTALTRCLVKWSRVRRADDLDGYVYRVLVNCFHDSRRRYWNAEYPSDEVGSEAIMMDLAEQVSIADAIHRGLATLSTDHRDMIVLRYFADLTVAQVAFVLGVPVGTVKSRLARARARLAADINLSALNKGEL